MKNLMHEDKPKYIHIPVNQWSALAGLFVLLLIALGGNWFFGNYRLRSPIVVQSPIVARFPAGIQKVNAEEIDKRTTHPANLSPTPKPKVTSMVPVVEAASMDQPKHYTTQEIIDGIKAKFSEFGPKDVAIAVAIAKTENIFSRGYFICDLDSPMNSNGSTDRGLFQINSTHWNRFGADNMRDCFKNMDAAYQIRKEQGNWSAWTTYTTGSYIRNYDDNI